MAAGGGTLSGGHKMCRQKQNERYGCGQPHHRDWLTEGSHTPTHCSDEGLYLGCTVSIHYT